MSIHEEVIKDIGIYGIQLAITLNGGAFGILLSKAQSGEIQKWVFALYLFGLFMAVIQIAITYYIAQHNLVESSPRSFLSHMIWMMLPITLSYLSFFGASIIAILKY